MPEGPEIRIEADRIAAVLAGFELEDAWFASPSLRRKAATLAGVRVTAVETRGKAMLTRFDNGQVLYTHNQLYGRWFVRQRDDYPQTNRTLRVALHTAQASALLYSASTIELFDESALQTHAFLARLGPDALSETLTGQVVAERLGERAFAGRALGSLYLDQGFIAGIGNYLRSEILFFARLNPRRRPRDLSHPERQRLARQTLVVTQRAYRSHGITNPARRVTALKSAGSKRSGYRFAVFGRDGLPCYDCGAAIERLTLNSRRLYWCASCQT